MAGRSNEYTVRLATEPTGEVTVTVSGHAGTAVTPDKTTLTFTTDNWDTAQTVTVSATRNAATAKVTLAHAASGADYGSVTAEPVVVSVVGFAGQQPTLQVGVSSSAQTLTVPEGGANSYTLVLGSQPTGDVTVGVTLPAGTDLTLDKTTLTFTVDNWDVAQTVAVTAAEDDDGVTDAGVTLTHTVSGGGYGSTTVPDVEVSITENDTAGLVISKDSLTVTEGDAAGSSYTVKLATRPTGTVTVSITGHAGTDLTLDKTTLTFTADNWDAAQTVTVKAGEDDDAANDTGTLTHTASGGGYASVSNTLPVTVTDDDEPDIVLSKAGLTVTEGDAAGSSYTVKLATQPSDTVIVTISGHDGADLTLSGTTLTNNQLTFTTTTNWGTAQTVTVKASDDDNTDDESETLAHTASGGDYVNITKDLPVSITDDGDPAVTVSFGAGAYTVLEGAEQSVTVTLSADPERTVVVPITHTPQDGADSTADYTVPPSVTFNTGQMSQTITFEAIQDEVDDDDESVRLSFGTLPPAVSLGTTTQATVTITDDDGPQVTVSFGQAAYTVAEGGTQSVTVTLSADPERTVVIPITHSPQNGADSPADYTVPPSVTFNTGQMSQTITFTAAQDEVDDDGESVLLGFGTPLPGGVTAGTTNQTTVTITGDCADGDIWCTTATFDAKVEWEGRYDLYTGEVDNREFSYNGEDYQLWSLEMVQNGRNAGDDNHVVLPFGIPERTLFLIDFFNLNGTGHDRFEAPNDDWLDWTLHVSTVSDGETLTAALRFSEGRKLAGAWWRWSGGDIDDLRRAWKPGQLYKLRLVEDPRAQRTSQPLNPPLYLRVEGEVNTTQTWLRWLTPQTRYDRVPPVDSYKIQWKQSSGSWDAPADVSETTQGPSRQRAVSHFLDGLTPGVEYNIRVIATDSAGDSEPSNEITYAKPAAAQQSLSNSPAEGEPRIDGSPEVGQTLSADTTAISDADGLENAVFQYQWLAEDADISGATGATYTGVSGDVGKAITVRVAFTDDRGNEETLTSAPTTTVVMAAGLQLQSVTVDGVTLTLTYNEVLDTGVSLPQAAFAVNVNGESRSLIGVGVGESNMLLVLSSAVEAGDTVTVDYTAPDGPDFIRDIRGRKAASFSGQAVTNAMATDPGDTATDPGDTATDPLTAASAHDAPSSHNGQDAFTFELRFSADPQPDFSYTTVRDHAFTVTGGSVTYVRRLEPGRNVRWEITVTPGSSAAVALALNATTDCSAQGAICTQQGGKLSSRIGLVVPGPETSGAGLPTITGTAQVGETLTVDTSGITDDDGLISATFAYQWLVDNTEIQRANGSTYRIRPANEGRTIRVKVSFTDDGGNDETLTSAATGEVTTRPNSPATGAPTISGTARVGDTLTAVTSGIEDADGLDNVTFNHQWLADDAEITGATGGSYILADADEGKTIKVQVSFTDDGSNDEILTSVATAAVAPKPNSPATGAPTISGTTQAGETLTSSTTGIADGDGLPSATFTYQWLADDADIAGATGSSYTLVDADAGKTSQGAGRDSPTTGATKSR